MLYRQLRDLPPTGDAELDATREKDLLKMQSQMDKILLALIHQACKTERPMRALELCTMVYMEKTLQLAYQLANASHAPSLAHRIELVRQAKFGDGVAVVAQRPRVVEKPRSVARPVKKPIALMPSMAAVAPVAMSHDEESKDERVTAIVEEAPKSISALFGDVSLTHTIYPAHLPQQPNSIRLKRLRLQPARRRKS